MDMRVATVDRLQRKMIVARLEAAESRIDHYPPHNAEAKTMIREVIWMLEPRPKVKRKSI